MADVPTPEAMVRTLGIAPSDDAEEAAVDAIRAERKRVADAVRGMPVLGVWSDVACVARASVLAILGEQEKTDG